MAVSIKICTPDEYSDVLSLGGGFICKVMAGRGVTAYVAGGVKNILADKYWDALMDGWGDQD